MILRRLAAAFRRQNWSTVGVEMMIVVLGVFIGIQVANWNEWRQDRALEQEYLGRLYGDVVMSIEDNLDGLAWDEERARTQRLVLDALDDGVLTESQRADFDAGLIYFGYQNTITMRWATVEELRSTGKMAVIRDIELRDMLAQAEANFDYRSAQTETLTERIRNYREHVDSQFAPLEYNHRLNGPVTLAYDFDALVADDEFFNMLAQIEFYASLVRRNMSHHIDRLNALKDSLGEALGENQEESP